LFVPAEFLGSTVGPTKNHSVEITQKAAPRLVAGRVFDRGRPITGILFFFDFEQR